MPDMPVPTDITAGTLTITNGSTAVTGVGTSWLASDLRQGDVILWIEGGDGFQTPILADVPASNTALTLVEPWEGPTLTGVRYRIRYQWDSSRVSAQSRQLIELLDNGNILALASLTGPGVPVFDGPHSMTIRPTQDFINGVAYDVQVGTLPDRAAYDGQAAGFSVLVSDVGDGRSAVYSKASNTSGDWTDPAYVTGPVGPLPGVEATVTTGAPGSTATVGEVPITGGVRLDFTLPAAEGFYNAGVYDSGAAYTKDQVVRHNGSSFIALQAVPAGTSPSSAFPPVDTAYWQVLAARGANGAGTVSGVVGGTGIAIDNTDPTQPEISWTSTIQAGSGINIDNTDPTQPEISWTSTIQAGTGIDVDNTDPSQPVISVDPDALGKLPPKYWQGFGHVMNVSVPATRVDIGAGSARNSVDTADIICAAGTIDLTTTGANGRDGGSLLTGTWYYTFAIRNAAGATAFLASTSPSAPTLPSGYTSFRRIGAVLLDMSSVIVPFVHVNDTWYWKTTRRDINTGATVGTSFITSNSISLPRIFGLIALGSFTFFAGSGAINAFLMPTFLPDTSGDGFAHNVGATGGAIPTRVAIDASAQVKYKSSSASSTFVFDTAGWIDPL